MAAGLLICVYAFAGGIGTSCASVGIGRELSRYRGEKVMYLSLEETEDKGLFPEGVRAMSSEEVLFRYLRLKKIDAAQKEYDQLFHMAAACDEYGLCRFAPDDGVASLPGMEPGAIYSFLEQLALTLGLRRIVLDFGTRIRSLREFAEITEEEEAFFIEVPAEEGISARKTRPLFVEGKRLTAVFPRCGEDVRSINGHTEVGLSNAFGLAIKELCDRITGVGS